MDEKQIEKMLSLAAAKLGMTPEQLKKAATDGNADEILSHLDRSKADKVRQVMKDKKMTDSILDSLNKNNSSL